MYLELILALSLSVYADSEKIPAISLYKYVKTIDSLHNFEVDCKVVCNEKAFAFSKKLRLAWDYCLCLDISNKIGSSLDIEKLITNNQKEDKSSPVAYSQNFIENFDVRVLIKFRGKHFDKKECDSKCSLICEEADSTKECIDNCILATCDESSEISTLIFFVFVGILCLLAKFFTLLIIEIRDSYIKRRRRMNIENVYARL